jgi:hypothetical protein
MLNIITKYAFVKMEKPGGGGASTLVGNSEENGELGRHA